jgi:hypothetical protein
VRTLDPLAGASGAASCWLFPLHKLSINRQGRISSSCGCAWRCCSWLSVAAAMLTVLTEHPAHTHVLCVLYLPAATASMGSIVQDKYEKGCYYVDGQTWQVRAWNMLDSLGWCAQSGVQNSCCCTTAHGFKAVTQLIRAMQRAADMQCWLHHPHPLCHVPQTASRGARTWQRAWSGGTY